MSESPDTQAEAVTAHICRNCDRRAIGRAAVGGGWVCLEHAVFTPSAEPDGEAQGDEFGLAPEGCPGCGDMSHVVICNICGRKDGPMIDLHADACTGCGETLLYCATNEGDCCGECDHPVTPAQDGAEDSLAAEIRRVTGTHVLYADAWAEALMPWLAQRDKDRDAAVAAKVGEREREAVGLLNDLVTAKKLRLDAEEWQLVWDRIFAFLARAAAPAGEHG